MRVTQEFAVVVIISWPFKAVCTLPHILFVSLLGSGVAVADADDKKWIAQCIKDNKNEGAKEEVVYKYCDCMNDQMSSAETRSINADV